MTAFASEDLPPKEAGGASLPEHALGVLSALRRLFGGYFRLLGLEARLAGLSLAGIIAAAVVAAFCLIAAWLLLQALALLALMRLDIGILWLLGAFSALNVIASAGLFVLIRRLGRNLMFTATGRALSGRDHAREA